MKTSFSMKIKSCFRSSDVRWAFAWFTGISMLGIWDLIFLNRPALKRVSLSFVNTYFLAMLTTAVTLGIGWAVTMGIHSLKMRESRVRLIILTFCINLSKSVPQVLGILFGYIAVATIGGAVPFGKTIIPFFLLAFGISIFIFPEMVELLQERIAYYRAGDFYSAMRVCGVSENRIVNFHILWRNSRIHIFNKLISIFGMAVFLQCSVDFIVSVGLTTSISSVSLPVSLGKLLANIDSKQDILAIGYTLTHPFYLPKLFFQHLQGITVAILIVFTLLCTHRISNGFARRHRL